MVPTLLMVPLMVRRTCAVDRGAAGFATLQADVVAAMAKAGQRGSCGMGQPPRGGDQLFQPGALLALEQFDHPRDLRALAGRRRCWCGRCAPGRRHICCGLRIRRILVRVLRNGRAGYGLRAQERIESDALAPGRPAWRSRQATGAVRYHRRRSAPASASPSRGPGNGILWAETGGRFQPQNAGERPEFGSQTATRLTNRPELRGFLPARKPRRFACTVWFELMAIAAWHPFKTRRRVADLVRETICRSECQSRSRANRRR